MKYRNIVLLIILMLLSGNIYAQTPEEVVKRFCTMRYDGTAFKNLSDYDNLIVLANHIPEPGWDRFFIIDTFAIVSSKVDGYTAFVDVSYKTFGIYSSVRWIPGDTTEIKHFYLVNTVDGWKIDRTSIENPRVSVDFLLTNSTKIVENTYKAWQRDKSYKNMYDDELKRHNACIKLCSQLKELSNKRKQGSH
jgi:hypothetical protein